MVVELLLTLPMFGSCIKSLGDAAAMDFTVSL